MIRLREMRKNAGLTQKRLSELSGVPQQSISMIELEDRKNPGAETLYRLANALNVKMEDLIVLETAGND